MKHLTTLLKGRNLAGGLGSRPARFVATGAAILFVIALVAATQLNPPLLTQMSPAALSTAVAAQAATDTDGDGLPDEWETQFGLDAGSGSGQNGGGGDPDSDGRTNTQEFTDRTHPRGFNRRFLAEGATSSFFDTQLALFNPGTTAAKTLVRFQDPSGGEVTRFLEVPSRTRSTLAVKDVQGMGEAAFATLIESDQVVVVDRTMSWDSEAYGAHAETSLPAPALTWHFAEGATHSGFSLFYLLQNPSLTQAAEVRIRYLLPSGAPLEKSYTLGPRSRTNIWVNQEEFPSGSGNRALASVDVSAAIEVTNGVPIIAERAMYLDTQGRLFGAGHAGAGISNRATRWYFAEGATGPFFDLFVLVANSESSSAQVTATFLLPDGAPLQKQYTVPANSRFNIWVDQEDPRLADTAVSTIIETTNGIPIVAERAMWWAGLAPSWYEAHNSAGSTQASTRWALADGEVGGPRGIETYILLANPNALPIDAKVSLYFEDGSSAERTYPLAGRSRTNVPVGTDFPTAQGRRFGALVEAVGTTLRDIVVERAIYWNAAGQPWAAGTNALGTPLQAPISGQQKAIRVSPTSGRQSEVLALTIEGTDTHFAQGQTTVDLGVGIRTEQIEVQSTTRLVATIVIAPDAVPGVRDVAVMTGGELGRLEGAFTVAGVPAPTITSFSPTTAKAGTLITVRGTNLAPVPGGGAFVQLARHGGGEVSPPPTRADGTELTFVVPPGTATGPVSLVINGKSARSAGVLTVQPSNDFLLQVEPARVEVIRGQTAVARISLVSSNGFSQLAPLAVSGLPAGVTSEFRPRQIGAGNFSVMTFGASTGQATGEMPVSVTASATVDGQTVSSTARLTLVVRPVSTTFMGRTVVDDARQTPLAGVTVSMLGRNGSGQATGCSGTTVSDAAGNFALASLPPECVGNQLIRFDGSTATNPPGEYAGVDLAFNLRLNEVTVSPVLVHLPRIDNAPRVMVRQNWPTDQVFTFPGLPGVSATVYAGTTLTLLGGGRPDPFPFIAVQVPIDRLPDEMPPDPTGIGAYIVAFQPANTTASQPVAVSFPNTLNNPPGRQLRLSTLDPTKGVMVIYGTGTVSADGAQIVPDLNPATPGKRYGITNFDWHGPVSDPGDDQNNPLPDDPAGVCPVGDPVDPGSGLQMYTAVDLSIAGPRGTIALSRVYRNGTGGNQVSPTFGRGTTHGYDWRLNTNRPGAVTAIDLVAPGGTRYAFAKQSDGLFRNTTSPVLGGASIQEQAGDRTILRFKDGSRFEFRPSVRLLASYLEAIIDRNGNTIRLEYEVRPTDERLTKITDPVGRSIFLEYRASSPEHVERVRDSFGRTVTYSYVETERVGSGGGGIALPRYSVAAVTDAEGGVTRYEYDYGLRRLKRIINPRGHVAAENTYDEFSRVKTQRRADGGVWRFDYTLSNPLSARSPVTQTVVTDPRGNPSTYRFSPQGYLLSATDALGQTRVFERDAANRVVRVSGTADCGCSGAQKNDFTAQFDSIGNIQWIENALGHRTTFSDYTSFNKPQTVKNGLDEVTTLAYDDRGNLKQITDPLQRGAQFEYDAAGLVIAISDGLQKVTQIARDAAGHPETITDPLGNQTGVKYDGLSRVVETVDADGRRATFDYDRLDRTVSVRDGRGFTTRYKYDVAGNLELLTNARGKEWRYEFDEMNRLRRETSPTNKILSYGYDVADNLTSVVNRRQQEARYDYDALNRTTLARYVDANVQYDYDARGRLVRLVDTQSGEWRYEYDLADQLAVESGPVGTIRYAVRDALGRVRRREIPGLPSVSWDFDSVGNLKVVEAAGARIMMSYDARNALRRVERSNGTLTRYDYDDAGRLRFIVDERNGAAFNTQEYAYHPSGRLGGYSTFLGQALITPARTGAFRDDDQLYEGTGVAYDYDDDGNRTVERYADGSQRRFEWDSRGRLVRAVRRVGAPVDVRYDPAGNVAEVVSSERRAQLSDESTQTAALLTPTAGQVVLGGKYRDDHLATVSPLGVEFLHKDGLGSAVSVTGGAGAGLRATHFEAFGAGTAEGGGFGFTGRPVLLGHDIVNLRARFLDPSTGVFLSRDPLGVGIGPNAYGYADGDPINMVDPDGLYPLMLDAAEKFRRLVEIHAMADAIGRSEGYRMAHCWGSCEVAREFGMFGPAVAVGLGEVNESHQLVLCVLAGANCHSAYAPQDKKDNRLGYTCPLGMTCERRCVEGLGPKGPGGWTKTPEQEGPHREFPGILRYLGGR